jgi:hypothetical protein
VNILANAQAVDIVGLGLLLYWNNAVELPRANQIVFFWWNSLYLVIKHRRWIAAGVLGMTQVAFYRWWVGRRRWRYLPSYDEATKRVY